MQSKKFMQVLDTRVYRELGRIAKLRGVNVQELIRVELVPTFLYGPIEFDKKTLLRYFKVAKNGSSRKVSRNRPLPVTA